MELLRKMTQFTKSSKEKLHIYKIYKRRILEQSCVVWGSNNTKQCENELERVQKVAVRLISNNYTTYSETLKTLQLETLKERRHTLMQRFAEKCSKNNKVNSMFEVNNTTHKIKLRNKTKYRIINAKTVRLQKFAIPFMTRHLDNKHEEKRKIMSKLSKVI